ncbi:M15 family metallopeptidase [uncultured Thiodictyon sp.]|uniref:M15 family metallopeptidase n=1 Tax=uncultured Thiodictyon sp. TaxID=1846217 RepID=UPI0025D2DC3C|nr:M15 family metallopeptidase [uncultured Thiodictyon sp.]
MTIPRTAIALEQKKLQSAGFDPGKIDGQLGDKTYRAAREALRARAEQLPKDWQTWGGPRQAVAYLQLLCLDNGIAAGTVDGYWGPQTTYAVETLDYRDQHGQPPALWRDDEPEPKDLSPPAQAQHWPRQAQGELVKFYGEPGKHQVSMKLPYPHRLAWDIDKVVNSFSCHEKVHDSLGRVLKRVHEHYGQERIHALHLDLWGGCLNVRKMRGGSNWSMHSWGIAIDYDPEHNQLKWGKDRARLAKPEYAVWWQLWEEEGWLSLGRTRNYDWMHVQAARL